MSVSQGQCQDSDMLLCCMMKCVSVSDTVSVVTCTVLQYLYQCDDMLLYCMLKCVSVSVSVQ